LVIEQTNEEKNMPITVCTFCRDRVLTARGNNDVIHQCNSGDSTRDNEDITQIGTWEDYTGSGGGVGYNIWYQGVQNMDFGTDSWLMGGFTFDVSFYYLTTIARWGDLLSYLFVSIFW